MNEKREKLECLVTGALQVNSWIVPIGGEYVFVVDPAANRYTTDETLILNYLKAKNLKLAGILLTHGHFDHIAGTSVLKNAFPDCPIAIHRNDAFMTGKNAPNAQKSILAMLTLEALLPTIRNLPEADILLADGENLGSAFGTGKKETDSELEKWEIIHTPGHTPGSICLYNKEKAALISGDTVFYHAYGRSDFPYGNEGELVKSIKRLAERIPRNTLVYPGHEIAGFEAGCNF